MSVYLAFIRSAFLNMLAYRMRYYTGILTYLIFISVQYFIWKAVFGGRPDTQIINGYTLPEMVTYIAVAWISRSLYFSDIDEQIDDLVKTGMVSIMLIRPVNFQLMMLVSALGESLFRMIFFTLPISLVIVNVYPVALPSSLANLGFFVLATIFGFFIFAQFNFLVGMLAFYFKSINGIVRAKYYLVQFLSGLLLPMAFFPEWARNLLDILPFKSIAYTPLRFYLGKADSQETLYLLGQQIFWIVFLLIIGKLLWSKAVTKLTLQGG